MNASQKESRFDLRKSHAAKELFHHGERDPEIERAMRSQEARALLEEIRDSGYPIILVAKRGGFLSVKASSPRGPYVKVEANDPMNSLTGGLRKIVETLRGKGGGGP